MKKLIWSIINALRSVVFSKPTKVVYVMGDETSLSSTKTNEIIRRLNYFDPTILVQNQQSGITFKESLDYTPLVYLNADKFPKLLKLKKNDVFNLDFESNYLDGWDYHYLLSKLYPDIYNDGVISGYKCLHDLKIKFSMEFDRSYIFGTGPSLEKAIDYDFNDGIRIVSNTIVKDEELWLHLQPNFIVAGDAIYHFGIGQFAQKFRRDLKIRLQQTDTYFVYPAHFHVFCVKEFADFKNKLVPIPIGSSDSIHKDMTVDYTLPIHGNVLLLLLLPLACTLTKNVGLWGFDGRSPNDKLFWSNSSKHFYTEDVQELMDLHPKFFEKLVPKDSPDSYVKKVHGDVLENGLIAAEKEGLKFKMLHHSYTETLSKRFEEYNQKVKQ